MGRGTSSGRRANGKDKEEEEEAAAAAAEEEEEDNAGRSDVIMVTSNAEIPAAASASPSLRKDERTARAGNTPPWWKKAKKRPAQVLKRTQLHQNKPERRRGEREAPAVRALFALAPLPTGDAAAAAADEIPRRDDWMAPAL